MKRSTNTLLGFAAVTAVLLFSVTCGDKGTEPPPKNTNPEGVLYVLNQKDTSIYIYDSHTHALADSIRLNVPVQPHHIMLAPNHDFGYIIGRTAPGQFAKLDLETNEIVTKVTAPSAIFPTSMALSADGLTGYVCDYSQTGGGGHIHRWNLASMTYLDSIYQSGLWTHDIKSTSDRTTLIACNYKTDNLTIIYTNGDSVTFVDCAPGGSPSTVEIGPFGAAVDRNDSLVYIGCRYGKRVLVLDLAARTIVDSILVPGPGVQPAGPSFLIVSNDNKKLYTSTFNDNSVAVIDLTTRTVTKTIPFSATQSAGVDLSEDGTRLYVACVNPTGQGWVYVIETAGDTKIDSMQAGKESYGVHFHGAHH